MAIAQSSQRLAIAIPTDPKTPCLQSPMWCEFVKTTAIPKSVIMETLGSRRWTLDA